jgi:hypothetical protein
MIAHPNSHKADNSSQLATFASEMMETMGFWHRQSTDTRSLIAETSQPMDGNP